MWCCVDPGVTDVLEESIASIFMVEKSADAGSPFPDFSTLEIEEIHSSETSFKPGSTQHHIPEDDILQNVT
jgi:hypothetical protein